MAETIPGMRLHIPADQVRESVLAVGDSGHDQTVTALVVGGAELSLIVADRKPGYHSSAHTHDSEQLNYVLQGELWVFVEDEAFYAKAGDFFRVPRGALHWSWVQGDVTARLVEAHAPGMARDPMWRGTTSQFDWSGEPGTVARHADNVMVPGVEEHMAAVEARYVGGTD